jgi:hypothetical protein
MVVIVGYENFRKILEICEKIVGLTKFMEFRKNLRIFGWFSQFYIFAKWETMQKCTDFCENYCSAKNLRLYIFAKMRKPCENTPIFTKFHEILGRLNIYPFENIFP